MHPYFAKLKTKQEQQDFKKKFIAYVKSTEPSIFEPISYDYIKAIFDNQGRWAGISLYIYIDEDGNFSTGDRGFGSMADMFGDDDN